MLFGFQILKALQTATKKVNKTVALVREFRNSLWRHALLSIYICFARTQLDYDNIIFDQVFSNTFHQKIESLQRNAALAITVVFRERSKEKKLMGQIQSHFNKDVGI